MSMKSAVGTIGVAVCGVMVAGLVGGCGDGGNAAGSGNSGAGGTMAAAGTGGGTGAGGSGGAVSGAGGSGGAASGAGGEGAGMASGVAGAGAGTAGGGAGTAGGGSGAVTGTGTAGGGGGGNPPPPGAAWLVDGGDAPMGRASAGGVLHVVSQGAVTLGASVPGQAPVPVVPADAFAVDSAALGADVSAVGSIRIDGSVVAGGSEPVRQITSTGGDIFVSGSLRAGDAGGAARSLTLRAPNGAVYVTGTIDTSGANPGQGGGALSILAKQVVVIGGLSASGADGPTGGNGGAITIAAGDMIFLGGPLHLQGGAGSVTGGAGGSLLIDGMASVHALDLVDARGGAGVGAGASAGVAGGIRVGEQAHPLFVNVAVPLSARGGSGGIAGGKGGAITLEPQVGNLVVAGGVDFGGGDSGAQPGDGGTLVGLAGAGVGDRMVDGGDITVTGRVSGNGGAISVGGSGNGATAGTVTIQPLSVLGALSVDAPAMVTLNGGASGGAGVAGGGGHLFFTTSNGNLTVAGKLALRGGDARDPGGTGGLGGAVDIFSDQNYDGFGGNLLLDTTAVIDASGGDGTIGGSARNDGSGGVASFPDDMEMIAVLINCDGKHGTTDNWLDNKGWIIARGGAANGNGGDIAYHGISPDRNSSPPSGNIDNAGNGSGMPGDFAGE